MKKHSIKIIAFIICFATVFTLCGCNGSQKAERITDVITEAERVAINGKDADTVEAKMGAFQGKQGDYIEFFLSEPKEINTVFINEKTATIRQYNIFAEIDGKYTLVHTGKHVFSENIYFDTVTATAIKVQIVNTEIGNDNFIIQGINAYNLPQDTTKGE